MMNPASKGAQNLPFVDQLRSAVEYLYFNRRWWPAGDDVVIYWRGPAGDCHRFIHATGGDSLVSNAPVRGQPMELNDGIRPAEFEELKAFSVQHGILEAQTQQRALTTAHCFDTYLVRLEDGRENAFAAAGAKFAEERWNSIRTVFLGQHGLGPFYESLHRAAEDYWDRQPADEEKNANESGS